MHNFRKVMFLFATAALILACGIASAPSTAPSSQDIATIVAGTLQAITAAAPTAAQSAPQAMKISFMNSAIAIPNGLGTGADAVNTDNVEMPPFVNPSGGPMPLHIVFTIKGYPIGREARIAIFKASDYASYADFTQNVISALQALNFQTGGKVPQELGSTFEAAAVPLATQNGHGLRYITQIMEAVTPISNNQVYYYYQGLTNDKAYFVMAVLPVNAAFLAPTDNPDSTLPANGVPFPPFSNPNASTDDINAYYNAIQQKMNTAAPNDFTPPLATLDALIQSITVSP